MAASKLLYKVGDLVKVKEATYHYMDISETFPGGMGLVVGRTDSWYEAYEQTKQQPDLSKTHYWDNVNYSPYRVLMCGSHEMEWISPEHMEPAYDQQNKDDE